VLGLALEETVQGPDFACSQSLEANAHAAGLASGSRFHPTDLSTYLDGFGLGRDLKTHLQSRLQWKGLAGFHEEATQGNIDRGGGAFLVTCNDLDV